MFSTKWYRSCSITSIYQLEHIMFKSKPLSWRISVHFTNLNKMHFYFIKQILVQCSFIFSDAYFSSKNTPHPPFFYIMYSLSLWLQTRYLNKNKGLPVLPAGDENPAGETWVREAVNPAFMLFMVLWKKRLKTTFGSLRVPLFCWWCRNAEIFKIFVLR